MRACAAVVAFAVFLPWLAPGYVLSYDMVFVPHQPLRWDLVAPPNGLPRAVPLDAIVSVLTTVVPGALLQRAALFGIVYAAALGAGRLVPTERRATRLVAAVVYAWTPFVAERLLLGQWALLAAYAALPWVVGAALAVRDGRPGAWPRLVVPAAVSAVTPTGGLIALAATLVLTGRRGWPRAAGAVLALNAPWVVSALTASATGRSDPTGVTAFAARGENWSGPFGALLGTGGVWNAQTTPGSRASVFVPLITLALVAVAVVGFAELRRRWPSGGSARLAALGLGGFALALLGVVPGTAAGLEWTVAHVPGAGLLRDGQKFLIPYALLLALGAALGAQRLAARLARPRARLVFGAMLVLPVAVLPDLAYGVGGQLRPARYPPDWDRVAAIVAADPGEVVSLPLSLFRRYAWNHNRTVLDPAPRYLAGPVLTDDTLYVGDLVIGGEDPRVAPLRRLVEAGRPVAATGARWVLVQPGSGGTLPAGSLAGLNLVYAGPDLELYANPSAAPRPSPGLVRIVLVVAAYLGALVVFLLAALALCLPSLRDSAIIRRRGRAP